MKTLLILGLVAFLSVVGFGFTSAATHRAVPAAPGASEYVYLHVTRSEAVTVQTVSRADTCSGASAGVRS